MKIVLAMITLISMNAFAGENCTSKPIKEGNEFIGCKTEINGKSKKHLPGVDGLSEKDCESFCSTLTENGRVLYIRKSGTGGTASVHQDRAE